MKFAINEKFTEARMWLSEFIKPTPKQTPVKAVTPSSSTKPVSSADIKSLIHLIRMGNNLSSVVRDKQIDRLDNWSLISARNDVRQLNAAFKVVEALHRDPTLSAVNASLTRDGIKKGFTFEFSATKNNEDQKIRARILNEICQPIASLINGDQWSRPDRFLYEQDIPITLADTSYNIGVFGQVPCHLQYNSKNIIERFRPVTPFMWQINSDASFRFPDPEKAYVKFGSETQELDKFYPATNILWPCSGIGLDQRYAIPPAYNLAVEVGTLQHIINTLKESRTQGSPRTFVFAEGQAGQGLTLAELQRLLDQRPEEALMRGDYLGPLANIWNQVIPGKGDVKTVNASTGAYNEFGDANIVREIITASYRQHFGLFFDTHKANRNTLDLMVTARSEARRSWKTSVLTFSLIFPAFCRQIVAAGISSNGLICEAHYDEDKTFAELEAEAKLAIELKREKAISWDALHSTGCKALSIDAKVDKQSMEQEKENPNDLESQLANTQLTSEQLIKNSLPNITKNDFERLNQTLLSGLEKIQDIVQSNQHLN